MISASYVRLMAAYGEWQNRSLYAAAGALSDAERRLDRGAFFGSIHATLDHLLWGDQLWMHRLAGTARPAQADIAGSTSGHPSWDALVEARQATDQSMVAWAERVTEADLGGALAWHSAITGTQVRRPRWVLVVQLFNHGTHHRGQVHAMLTAAGTTPGDTDLQYLDSAHFAWPAA